MLYPRYIDMSCPITSNGRYKMITILAKWLFTNDHHPLLLVMGYNVPGALSAA